MIDQLFFSFNKKNDWNRGLAYNLYVSEQEVRINQLEKYSVAKNLRFSTMDLGGRVLDFAIGANHQLFLLDEQCNIWRYDWENHLQELLFATDAKVCSSRAKLTILQDNLIIADQHTENSLTAYSLSNGQIKWSVSTWKNAPLFPLAIHSDQQDHLYLLVPAVQEQMSRTRPFTWPADTSLVLLKIDKTGRIVRSFEHPELRLHQSVSSKNIQHALALAIAADGSFYLLNKMNRVLFHFSSEGVLVQQTSIMKTIQPSCLSIDGQGQLFIGDERKHSPSEEDERFILSFYPNGSFQGKIAARKGSVRKLLMDVQQRLFVLDHETNELTLLELTSRTRDWSGVGDTTGVFLSTALDSTEAETKWHKLLLEAHIPDETQIKISYFTSDRKQFLINGTYLQLDEYVLSSNISLYEKLRNLQPIWQDTLVNPKDALIFKGQGRYLWLKIELIGSEFKTPLIQKLRLYYPRHSYLAYLPEVYQEDKASKDFLERFLALFQTFFMEIEDEIKHVARYFDVDVASGDFLRWLSYWLGISNEERWTEEQLRKLIKMAPELYQTRGTKQAIVKMVELYTGRSPLIIEFFQYQHMRKDLELRRIVDRLYGEHPYTFTVIVEQSSIPTERERSILENILDEEKPAFTEVKLVALEENIYLDMYSYLGINSYLTEPSLLVLDAHTTMPQDTLLIDLDQAHRLNTHSRLGIDSELE